MTERGAPRWAALFRPLDAAWLAAFRLLYGVTMAVGLARFVGYGWLDTFLLEPRFHFKYWGLGWVEAPPAGALGGLAYALAALALCVAAGAFYRASALAFALGFTYLELLDVTTYLNHYYLAALLAWILALAPAERVWSVDAWRARRAGAEQRARVAAIWLYLLRFQVGLVYTCAGLAKAQSDWLLHAQPLRIWLGARTEMPWLGPALAWEWAAPLLSWLGFCFDLTIAGWLSWRRSRPYAFAALIVFHAITGALFPIGMFPLIMVGSALVFFESDWPRRLWRASAAPAHASAPHLPKHPRLWLAALALYGALQVVLPLRHLAYPGNVLWHEQGMRWSWRVMVREKNGSVSFSVKDADSGQQWTVSPARYLTRAQEREMSGQPDLILQLAHHIRDDFRARGHARVEVRARALVSLNARPMRLLIDPEVDLAAVEDSLGSADWIGPAPLEPPPHLRPVSG